MQIERYTTDVCNLSAKFERCMIFSFPVNGEHGTDRWTDRQTDRV